MKPTTEAIHPLNLNKTGPKFIKQNFMLISAELEIFFPNKC